MGRAAAIVPVYKLTVGSRAFSGGDTEGPVSLKTGPLSIARASNHSMLLVPPQLSQCSLKEAPSVRLDF